MSKKWESLESPNILFVEKTAVKYLKLRAIEVLKDRLESAIVSGDVDIGERYISEYSRIETNMTDGVRILNNPEAIIDAFIAKDEILFSFPGVLGRVIGPFVRGDLVAFLGVSGKGKTWWMVYVAVLAMMHGLRAVFIELELPEIQILRRVWQCITATPKKEMDVRIPKFSEVEAGLDEFIVEHDEEWRNGPVVGQIEKQQKNYKMMFSGGDIEVHALSSDSATCEDIETKIRNGIAYDNYIPDLIVIDSGDLLKSSYRGRDPRHAYDDKWKKMRRLAQDFNIAVVTATHGGREAYKKDANETHITEDIRKLHHVSKLIPINQSSDEYEIDVMRLKQLKERDGRRSSKEAIVLSCLSIGRPYIDSKYTDEVVYE